MANVGVYQLGLQFARVDMAKSSPVSSAGCVFVLHSGTIGARSGRTVPEEEAAG
jgi:hypothetical protein